MRPAFAPFAVTDGPKERPFLTLARLPPRMPPAVFATALTAPKLTYFLISVMLTLG